MTEGREGGQEGKYFSSETFNIYIGWENRLMLAYSDTFTSPRTKEISFLRVEWETDEQMQCKQFFRLVSARQPLSAKRSSLAAYRHNLFALQRAN